MTLESKINAIVIAVLSKGTITIILGPGLGMLNGGVLCTISLQLVPIDLRIPNSEFTVVFDANHEVDRIERLD